MRTISAIQQAALRLFAEQGFERTTVEQIAAAADVSPATFFRYYPAKEAVVRSDEFDLLLVRGLAERPPEEGLYEAVRAAVHQVLPYIEQARDTVLERYRLVAGSPGLRAQLVDAQRANTDWLAGALAPRLGREPADLQVRVVADPMLDLRLFRDPVFGWATAAVTLVSVAMFGLLFVLPQYLQVVAGHDAFGTGLRLLPMIGALVVGGAASDRLAARVGGRPVIAAGLVVLAAGLVAGSRVTATSGYGLLAAGLVVIGLGLGLAMPTAMDAIMGVLPADEAGVGIAVTTALRMVAGALGVALLPSVLSSVYTHRVADAAAGSLTGLSPEAAAQVTAAATDSVAGAAEVARTLGPAGSALRGDAFTAFADGMSLVLLLCAAVAVVGAVLIAVFLPAPVGPTPAAAPAEDRRPVPIG